jgi:hypothetical protein
MPTTTPSVGRLDKIISELERLHSDAQGIFDAHVDYLRTQTPGVPFGVVKRGEITGPAGNTVNYIAALRIVRKSITGA